MFNVYSKYVYMMFNMCLSDVRFIFSYVLIMFFVCSKNVQRMFKWCANQNKVMSQKNALRPHRHCLCITKWYQVSIMLFF